MGDLSLICLFFFVKCHNQGVQDFPPKDRGMQTVMPRQPGNVAGGGGGGGGGVPSFFLTEQKW